MVFSSFVHAGDSPPVRKTIDLAGEWRVCLDRNAAPAEPFLYEEGKRMLEEYGNHPSFAFLAHGNDPWELDQKKLAAGAHYPIHRNNDFQNPGPGAGMPLRYHGKWNAAHTKTAS